MSDAPPDPPRASSWMPFLIFSITAGSPAGAAAGARAGRPRSAAAAPLPATAKKARLPTTFSAAQAVCADVRSRGGARGEKADARWIPQSSAPSVRRVARPRACRPFANACATMDCCRRPESRRNYLLNGTVMR